MEISWIQTILGILVGWQIPNIYQILKYLLYLRWKKHFLEGEWHCYHYSVENTIRVFRHEVWRISRSSLGGLEINASDQMRPKLKYKAKIMYEAGYLILDFNGIEIPEKWQARLSESIPGVNARMIGIMVAVDFDRHSFATPLLVTESETSRNEAQDILDGIAIFDKNSLSLRLDGNVANKTI